MDIIQDNKGFIWFATLGGLDRYDGYEIKSFRNNPVDSSTISENVCFTLELDHQNNIWVGTKNGVSRYNAESGHFDRFFYITSGISAHPPFQIQSIYIKSDTSVWLGSQNDGIFVLNPETKKWRLLNYLNEDGEEFPHHGIYRIHPQNDSTIWVGTSQGLYCADPQNETWKFYSIVYDGTAVTQIRDVFCDASNTVWIGSEKGLFFLKPNKTRFEYCKQQPFNNMLLNNPAHTLNEDNEGNLWVGTFSGLYVINSQRTGFKMFFKSKTNAESLSSNIITQIYRDPDGIMWLGTLYGGVHKFVKNLSKFEYISSDENSKYPLSDHIISSVLQDSRGNLWVGSYKGVDVIDKKGKTVPFSKRINPDANVIVFYLFEDNNGKIWIGTEQNGVFVYDYRTNQVENYSHVEGDSTSLSDNYIVCIYQDSFDQLWIGTRAGLNQFIPKNNNFKQFRANTNNTEWLFQDTIYSIREDSLGNLWMATNGGGLAYYDQSKNSFSKFVSVPQDSSTISHNDIFSLHLSPTGELWVGTLYGLSRFDRKSLTAKRYHIKDGLPDYRIYAILGEIDKNGVEQALWISTNKGLTRFDYRKNVFKNYDIVDGLQSDEYLINSACVGNDGVMYFGGINGLNIFHPDSIFEDTKIPPVVITDFQISNNSVQPNQKYFGKTVISKAISEADQINLSYKADVISFEFSALHYAFPERNSYAYYLEGMEDGWNYVGNRRFVTYSNLPSGDYVFHVKAANSDGVWNNDGTKIKIHVDTPFYQTMRYRIFMLLFFYGLIVLIFHLRTRYVHEKNRQLEALNERLNTEIDEHKITENQLNNSLSEKQVLLQEIHHRVKNNLQVISSLLNMQSNKITDDYNKSLFKESQDRIKSMALIHEQLYQNDDLANISFGDYVQSLVRFLSRTYPSEDQPVKIEFDLDNNLLLDIERAVPTGLLLNEAISNSFKHAFKGINRNPNKIFVSLKIKGNNIKMIISDNGLGMSPEIDINSTNTLGLYLLKILTEDQLEGTLDIKSDNGTRIEIVFPFQNK